MITYISFIVLIICCVAVFGNATLDIEYNVNALKSITHRILYVR